MTTLNPWDHIIYIEDKALRGSMGLTGNVIEGLRYTELDFGGPVFADTVGFLFGGILGDVTTTGAGAPYTHKFTTKSTADGQPTSYTFTDTYAFSAGGTAARQYPGSQIYELQIKSAHDGLLEYSAKAYGFPTVSVAKPSASFTTVTPSASWVGTSTVAGGAVTWVEDMELTLKRPITPIHTIQGSQSPYQLVVGGIEVIGKFTAVLFDDTNLSYYFGSTGQTTYQALQFDFQQGAGAALTEVKLLMTKAAWYLAKVIRGKEYVQVEVEFHGQTNTTDAISSTGAVTSPIQVTLQNALATGTYCIAADQH